MKILTDTGTDTGTYALRWQRKSRVETVDGRVFGRPGASSNDLSGVRVDVSDSDPGGALVAFYAALMAGAEACISPGTGSKIGQPNPDYGVFQTLTSGTTGAPRRIRRSQESWARSFAVNAEMFSLRASDRFAVLGRLSHSLSLYGAAEALWLGAGLLLLSGAGARAQLAVLKTRRATILYATPTQIRLMNEAGRDGTCAPDIRLVLCGGARLDPRTRALAGALFPNAAIIEFYGASETSFITLADQDAPQASVGRSYPGVEISLRAPDGTALPPGEIGQVWIRSPYVFRGYGTDDRGDTQWQDGFVSVGEFGRMDQTGNLYLKGRKGRLVTVLDQNVFPEEIEDILMLQAGVREAAVLPQDDALRGTRLIACIYAGSGEIEVASLRAACLSALGPLKTPKRFIVVLDWPRLASGKTDLNALDKYVSGAES